MKTYTGGCHCGMVKFEVDADLENTIVCNCSHCSKKGFILTFVDQDKFRLESGEEHLTSYQFNKRAVDHLFCNICGVQSFGRGITHPQVAINVRCLDGVDTDSLSPKPYNGKDA